MATRTVAGDGWTLRRIPAAAARGGRRGAAAIEPAIPPQFLQSDAVKVEDVFEATPAPTAARRGAPPDLVLDVDLEPGEESLVVIRHASGAITFHPSVEKLPVAGRRGAARAGAGATAARFRVPLRRVASESGRRGLVSKVVKVVVLKVAKAAANKAVSIALPKLAAAWEKNTWAKKKLAEGWFKVAPANGKTPTRFTRACAKRR